MSYFIWSSKRSLLFLNEIGQYYNKVLHHEYADLLNCTDCICVQFVNTVFFFLQKRRNPYLSLCAVMRLLCSLQKYANIVTNEAANLQILPIYPVHCTTLNERVQSFVTNIVDK